MTALYKCDICGEITRNPGMDCLVIGPLGNIKAMDEYKTKLAGKGIYMEDHVCPPCKQIIVNIINELKEKQNG